MTAVAEQLEEFVAFSAAITGFTEFELRGTGQAESFFSTVSDAVGDDTVVELLAAWARVRDEPEGAARDDGLRGEVFSDPKLGPVARNVIKLWYVGIWYELSADWIDAFGALSRNMTFMVSPSAYTEALLWPALGANPPGAKGPGWGSWSGPPRLADSRP